MEGSSAELSNHFLKSFASMVTVGKTVANDFNMGDKTGRRLLLLGLGLLE